jgi:hypothetical protein
MKCALLRTYGSPYIVRHNAGGPHPSSLSGLSRSPWLSPPTRTAHCLHGKALNAPPPLRPIRSKLARSRTPLARKPTSRIRSRRRRILLLVSRSRVLTTLSTTARFAFCATISGRPIHCGAVPTFRLPMPALLPICPL